MLMLNFHTTKQIILSSPNDYLNAYTEADIIRQKVQWKINYQRAEQIMKFAPNYFEITETLRIPLVFGNKGYKFEYYFYLPISLLEIPQNASKEEKQQNGKV